MSSARNGTVKRTHKFYPFFKFIGVLLAVFIVASVSTYVAIASRYRDKFIEGTTINNIDASNMVPEEVEELIREEVEDYDLTITFRDGEKETLTGEEIGYRFVPDGTIERFLAQQDPLSWLRGRLGNETVLEAEAKTAYDKEKLAAALEKLPELSGEDIAGPEDAYIEWQENAYTIIPEVEGNTINTERLLAYLDTVLSGSETEAEVTDEIYEHPEIYRDNEALVKKTESANALVAGTTSIIMPGYVTETIGPEDLREWIIDDQTGGYVLPEEVVRGNCTAFAEYLAQTYNTYQKDVPFMSQNFGEITINLTFHGWELDQAAVADLLAEAVMSHKDSEIEPVWLHKGFSMDADGIGKTYIEVDIASQHVYYFVDGELYMDTPVVTGTATSSERRTPTGVFLLDFKARDTYLQGRINPETGEPAYRSHVWYWMPFNGAVGFHDADGWRSRYGGTIFQYSGSHGCINMPFSAAKTMYEKIDKQTPIIVHWQR